jgi:hypothetical protein
MKSDVLERRVLPKDGLLEITATLEDEAWARDQQDGVVGNSTPLTSRNLLAALTGTELNRTERAWLNGLFRVRY